MITQASLSEKTLSYLSSCTWILDIGTDHDMTSKASQVHNIGPYLGHNGVLLGNSSKIPISSIGYSCFTTHSHQCMLSLTDLLYIPYATTKLLLVHMVCSDNNVLVGFYSSLFLVKDLDMRKVILKGSSENEVYKIHRVVHSFKLSSCLQNNYQSKLVALKVSLEIWHECTEHASF